MKLKEILRDIEVLQSTTDGELEISGISYDSRAAKPGDLFTAIVGFESDGHRYIPAAMDLDSPEKGKEESKEGDKGDPFDLSALDFDLNFDLGDLGVDEEETENPDGLLQ